jgi:hypothetical protein
MEFIWLCGIFVAMFATLCLILLLILTISWWILPIQVQKKLKRNGFGGPTPSFPLGNIKEMKRKNSNIQSLVASSNPTNDIHSQVFPYFSSWTKSHGKSFTLLSCGSSYTANLYIYNKLQTNICG